MGELAASAGSACSSREAVGGYLRLLDVMYAVGTKDQIQPLFEARGLRLPDTGEVLRPVSELLYNDVPWVAQQLQSDVHFCHPDVKLAPLLLPWLSDIVEGV